MLEEKELNPQIRIIDLDTNKVELVKTKLILKDGVELTRVTEHVYVDLANAKDVAAKIPAKYADELEYINKKLLKIAESKQ